MEIVPDVVNGHDDHNNAPQDIDRINSLFNTQWNIGHSGVNLIGKVGRFFEGFYLSRQLNFTGNICFWSSFLF